MLKFHKEGSKIIRLTLIISISLLSISILVFPLLVSALLLIAIVVLNVIILRFFRVPKREFSINQNGILAPADGRIVNIERVKETEYFNRECLLISIFMSVHNVHINWFPISGLISYYKYHAGKYLLARHPKSSELNERTSIVISNGKNEILVRQIAGYVARRIVSYAKEGEKISQADELGFIKFGSRLDVYLPIDVKIHVSLGDKTKGGISNIASFKQ